ncbi:MAG: SET domain-containing protein [Bdellovibrionales bacterium]|nr:SET domain-containing protein [Bdellovibrionales bacterium]
MLHPHTELKFVSPEIGYGIFATALIPKGTITWVKDELDRIIPKEDVAKMTASNLENLMKYSYRNAKGNYVFCWDLTRYVNHSYQPNSMLTALGFEIAIKDILPGEEMTNDYGTLNIIEAFKCASGPSHERDLVCPDDLSRFHAIWNGQINSAFAHISELSQPLNKFLTSQQSEEILHIQSGKISMPSVLENLFNA